MAKWVWDADEMVAVNLEKCTHLFIESTGAFVRVVANLNDNQAVILDEFPSVEKGKARQMIRELTDTQLPAETVSKINERMLDKT